MTVTDTNGCAYTETFTIVNVIDDLTASLSAIQGGCGVPGSIQVNVTGGTPGYTITWVSSNASGSFTTNNNTYYIQNLPSGIYTVSIEDANGCGRSPAFNCSTIRTTSRCTLLLSTQPVPNKGLLD